MNDPVVIDGMRLDAWLWVARFFKTRSLAKQAIELGRVKVENQDAKPSRMVRPGLRMQIERAAEIFDIQVMALAEKRGPPSFACTLYEESDASRVARENARALARAANAGYRAPESRPDKRARRLIRALGDIDAI
ncbi:RNA-binding S4 domain-containing protein [Solilutibacter tolerans]|uniref:Heat shock protein Hsp15 n=1 Tax=Solilutibacter tolerans TaxID=1604334 RepID=A0A1N6T792_9GAMM|nr:RNA-binding S4 domain-containing protein [Lysobacter tolerans]SIQ49248.1 heat shock protein Hsp15 [Lysobacter tolerans]